MKFTDTDVPKSTDHTHDGKDTWGDDELREHIKKQHVLQGSKVYLLNDSNLELLIREHQKAHSMDPISFEGMVRPPWAGP